MKGQGERKRREEEQRFQKRGERLGCPQEEPASQPHQPTLTALAEVQK